MVRQFQLDRGMPQYVMLADGDNELLINLENTTSVMMMLETVKNRDTFILKEFLHQENGIIYSHEGHHTNQVVVSFFNEEKQNHA